MRTQATRGEYKANIDMPSAATIRLQVESALAAKIPSALTPQPRMIRPQVPTGIAALDGLLGGGLPVGAVTELVGAECTGRTSVALSFLAQMTEANKVCAWVDASNAIDPASVAAAGVDLRRLLWVRCGSNDDDATGEKPAFALPQKYLIAAPPKKGLHGGGFGPHPRTEVRGLPHAMATLFGGESTAQRTQAPRKNEAPDVRQSPAEGVSVPSYSRRLRRAAQYDTIESALRSTDLLLQTGGFSAIVLDLASMAAEHVTRIELSTWHRYRVAAEKMQACFLLLTQYPCAKSGSELQLRLSPAIPTEAESTVFCGLESHLEIQRQRFKTEESNVIPMRKPVQSFRSASWVNRTSWADAR